MEALFVVTTYFRWHYTAAVINGVELWRTILWFWFRFFSVAQLLKSFFSPWRRLGETYGRTFEPAQWLETFLVNFLMRILGVIIKTVTLMIWLVVIVGTLISGVIFFLLWLLLPIITLLVVLVGLHLIITAYAYR